MCGKPDSGSALQRDFLKEELRHAGHEPSVPLPCQQGERIVGSLLPLNIARQGDQKGAQHGDFTVPAQGS